mgnify:CR=1 FL=1
MSKLSYEKKINLYYEKKNGVTIPTLVSKYSMPKHNIWYLIYLIDKHGFDILKKKNNNVYPKEFKENAINRVLLNHEPIMTVAIDLGLPHDSLLHRWIQKYKENGYNIVERKRGRSTMPKITKQKENETKDEKIKRLEEENLYLKAELEYSKKLRAVVQARKNQQQKKK